MDTRLVFMLAAASSLYQDARTHIEQCTDSVLSSRWARVCDIQQEAQELLAFEVNGTWPEETPE